VPKGIFGKKPTFSIIKPRVNW